MHSSEKFINMPPTKLFFACAIPAVISSVFGALYSAVDGIFVGRYLGEDALAAINLIMPIIMIVEAISNMIATGASVKMSVLLGERLKEEASKVLSFSIKFILIFSLLISVLGFVFARQFITFISPGASEAAISAGTEYLKAYALFGPLIPVYYATDNFLRVCGKGKVSLVISIVSQLLNMVLDFVLIAILHQGVTAAAVSSCISIVLGSVVTLAMFLGKRMDVYYTKENIPAEQFFSILANGSSELFSNIATSVMSVVMNLFLLKYGGTTAVAAFSIVMYVDSIIGMLNFGICDSLQPAISYCYGAKDIKRVKSIFKRVLTATTIISVASFLFMFLIGPYAARIFIKPGDTVLLKMSVTAVKIFALSYLAGWIDMTFSSLFTSLERPIRSLLVSLMGTMVLPIVFLFTFTQIWGLTGVWLMAPTSAAVSGAFTIILAKTMKIE